MSLLQFGTLCGLIIGSTACIYLHNQRNHEDEMAQIDDLNTALDTISTEIAKISTDVTNLVAELQAAQNNPGTDLSGAIAKAQAIESSLTAVDALVPAAPVAPTTDAPAV